MTVTQMWDEYVGRLGATPAPEVYTSGPFGAGTGTEDERAELVTSGWKTCDSTLLWHYDKSGSTLPVAGLHHVLTNSRGEAVAVVVTDSVEAVPFEEVTAVTAKLEGEGDLSLADWQERKWWEFNQQCKEVGKEAARDMPVVLNHFRIVHPSREGEPC